MSGSNDMPIMFSNGAHAYAWAEETLTRPAAKGMFAVLPMKTRGNGSGWSPAEIQSLAETICVATSVIEPATRQAAFRDTYGATIDRDRRLFLVRELYRSLSETDAGKRRTRKALFRVALVAITGAWREAQTGKKLPRSVYAKAIGVRRQSLKDGGWLGLIRDAERIWFEWVDSALVQYEEALRERGIIGTDYDYDDL